MSIQRVVERRRVGVHVRHPLAVEEQRARSDRQHVHGVRLEGREREDQRGEQKPTAQRVDLVPPAPRPKLDRENHQRLGEHPFVFQSSPGGAGLVLVPGWVERVPPLPQLDKEAQRDADRVDEERKVGVGDQACVAIARAVNGEVGLQQVRCAVGAAVVGAFVVGASVVGAAVVGAFVVGAAVVGDTVGTAVG